MTELQLTKLTLPTAHLGSENPFPRFMEELDLALTSTAKLSKEDTCYLGKNCGFRALPHRIQDSYTRKRVPFAHDVVVLENDILRATFMPSLGGKLYSLYHKPSAREILHRNPVYQPVNIALRNAWTSGGIEWNCGHFGHHYYTCSTIFSAKVEGPEGEPVYRIYEWDRVKGISWQVDFYLPEGSSELYWRVRIVNPHDHEVPMYWWTNIAVDEREDTRVIVPADRAITHGDNGEWTYSNLPREEGIDVTRPMGIPCSREFFYKVIQKHTPWIAALDKTGTGFFQISTDRLKGRKLFAWGACTGGRRFQEYLAEPGCAYTEIQTGLCRTQDECIPMPPKTEWTWTEACGLLHADAERVQSDDWQEARCAAEEAILSELSAEKIYKVDALLASVSEKPNSRLITCGSGWGELERRRKAMSGEADRIPAELDFSPARLGEGANQWQEFLETGVLTEPDPADEPGAFMVQPEWRTMLEESIKSGKNDHWFAWYHLGNMRMEARDEDGAGDAWKTSIARVPSMWAERNLAVLAERRNDQNERLTHLKRAVELCPVTWRLAGEYAKALMENKFWDDLDAFVRELPNEIQEEDHLIIIRARLALEQNDYERAKDLLLREFASVREGDGTLADLWIEIHERELAHKSGHAVDKGRVRELYPVPMLIDFRISDTAANPVEISDR